MDDRNIQMTPAEFNRKERQRINNEIEKAKTEATYAVLRKHCYEVDIKIEKRFCQMPTMIAVSCPCGGRNSGVCDTCDHLVQYSIKNRKAYCLKAKQPKPKKV